MQYVFVSPMGAWSGRRGVSLMLPTEDLKAIRKVVKRNFASDLIAVLFLSLLVTLGAAVVRSLERQSQLPITRIAVEP